MSHDRNVSPVDWYLATYQLRFVGLADPGNDNLGRRFLTWENTVLVRASAPDEAYDKTCALGMACTAPYQGGEAGTEVQWLFEGVTELLPIYEEPIDGVEIAWAEKTRSLRSIQARALSRAQATRGPPLPKSRRTSQ